MSLINVPEDEREKVLELSKQVCSPREHQVVTWSLLGIGTNKISVMLGVHQSTVRTHLRRAEDKLDEAAAA